jgi:hypothetical protein
MARKSSATIRIDPNIRCQRVYPTATTRKSVADLKTIGLVLTANQATHLARVLLAAAQDWSEIDITAYRGVARQSDGTYKVTVTSFQSD